MIREARCALDESIQAVEQAIYPFQIRAQFYRFVKFVNEPKFHNALFERIDYLKKRVSEQFERDAFEDLKDDIEIEMETGERYRKECLKKDPHEKFFKKIHDEEQEAPTTTRPFQFLRDDIGFEWSGDELLKKVSKELYDFVLERTRDNKTQAARILGVSVRTIRGKVNSRKAA